MLSFLLPPKIKLYTSPGYIKLEGPNGTFLKKIGSLKCYLVENKNESRLFVEGSSQQEESTALSHIAQLCVGLFRGYRRRLRLVGIGFRASIRDITSTAVSINSNTPVIYTKSYMRKRMSTPNIENIVKVLTLKIGYSHEFSYPLNSIKNINRNVSRLEGRTKGTVISLQGKNNVVLNQIASEIRAFRYPDSYKGKGIHYDREVIKLKKGKRQG